MEGGRTAVVVFAYAQTEWLADSISMAMPNLSQIGFTAEQSLYESLSDLS